ncbi:MAG: polysaccharide biosynthesis/export family protein, partial [Polyangiaceae bacterium]|nr:polysaccharide biosynthesis/export family protein [Polyangiaceae bacterium]
MWVLAYGAVASAQPPAQPAEPAPSAQAPAPPRQPAPATGPVEVTRVPTSAPGPDSPYGANLFTGNFAAQREDGLNPDYVILPGDRVQVSAWGAVNVTGTFAVDSQGNVFIPEIGPVRLGGVHNRDLTSTVRAAIGRIYRANFDVYTNLLTASPVAVYVTGAVRRPGRYAGIPSDSVLFYLDQAGGIEPELGSYRHVTVMRAGQAVAEIDLYDFLLNGVMQSPQFADGDAIVVGRRGPVVSLRGSVPVPALVELREEPFTGAEVLAVMPERPRANEVTVEGSRGGRPWVTTLSLEAFRATRLHAGDSVSVREDFRPESIVVKLEGEFLGPSVLTVRRGARLLDVLNHVHVEPLLANTSGVHIRRAEVAAQ